MSCSSKARSPPARPPRNGSPAPAAHLAGCRDAASTGVTQLQAGRRPRRRHEQAELGADDMHEQVRLDPLANLEAQLFRTQQQPAVLRLAVARSQVAPHQGQVARGDRRLAASRASGAHTSAPRRTCAFSRCCWSSSANSFPAPLPPPADGTDSPAVRTGSRTGRRRPPGRASGRTAGRCRRGSYPAA